MAGGGWPRRTGGYGATEEPRAGKGNAFVTCAANFRGLRRCEQVRRIERGDDFATDQEFLQVVAVTQLLVIQKAAPKI